MPDEQTFGLRRALSSWFDLDEPHQHRGPFARWPRSTDGILALTVLVISIAAVVMSALGDGEGFTFESVEQQPTSAFILLGAAAVSLLWRRHQPIRVAAVVSAVALVWSLAAYGDGHDLALAVAGYSVGRYTADHRLSIGVALALAAVSLVGTLVDPNQHIDIVPSLGLTLLPWYVGRRVRNRHDFLQLLRERAERLEAARASEAREAVAAERARIARELHDVVAHRVSMMTVQAGAAKTVAHDDLEASIEAMGDVEHEGRQALGELRHLLGVLRTDERPADELGPQPGIGHIGGLIEQLNHTGARATLDLDGSFENLPAAVDLSAYRIVQESLTNVIKHAGPRPAVNVAMRNDSHSITIEIESTIATGHPRANPEPPPSGFGLAGIRERVDLLDGTIDIDRRPERFRIRASLPLAMEGP